MSSNAFVDAYVTDITDRKFMTVQLTCPANYKTRVLSDAMICGRELFRKSKDDVLLSMLAVYDVDGPVPPLHCQEGYKAMTIRHQWNECARTAREGVRFIMAGSDSWDVAIDMMAPYCTTTFTFVIEIDAFDAFYTASSHEGGRMEQIALAIAGAVHRHKVAENV